MSGKSKFIIKRKVFALHFADDHELAGAEVKCRALPMAEFVKVAGLARLQDIASPDAEDIEEVIGLLDLFAEYLVEWNLAEDDGSDVPATAEGVKSLGLDVVMPMIAEWFTASSIHMNKDAPARVQRTKAGEVIDPDAGLIASLDMEALTGEAVPA